jgi:hypothetical protein
MKFRIKGEHNTFRASVTWEEGRLEGPEALVSAILSEARRLEGEDVKAHDADDQTYTRNHHLLDPHSAREIIRSLLDPNTPIELEVLEGEFPPAPRYRTRVNEV